MPSIGAVVALQRAREANENFRDNAGYVAIHPRDGVFLGVMQDGTSVFQPPGDIAPGQTVPVFFEPQSIPATSCPDTRILECGIYKVRVTDREKAETSVALVLDATKRRPDFSPLPGPASLASVFVMKAGRALSLPSGKNRPYKPPAL